MNLLGPDFLEVRFDIKGKPQAAQGQEVCDRSARRLFTNCAQSQYQSQRKDMCGRVIRALHTGTTRRLLSATCIISASQFCHEEFRRYAGPRRNCRSVNEDDVSRKSRAMHCIPDPLTSRLFMIVKQVSR